ncbi:hypothetical protein [Streptomyces tendae]|uniref:hypothetical protein n=1 Tax=Streptomyces tendae TaxID=1932 RepID=UPI00371E3830
MSGLKNGAEYGNFSTVSAEVSNMQPMDVMAHAGIQSVFRFAYGGFESNYPKPVPAAEGAWAEG